MVVLTAVGSLRNRGLFFHDATQVKHNYSPAPSNLRHLHLNGAGKISKRTYRARRAQSNLFECRAAADMTVGNGINKRELVCELYAVVF